ncbi:unnamed protein product [Allacma fusca]|uniref:E3 ubiquitin-protein ligase parkin n=1 Tax=Allacma fusca TaxID=39272 RepID=A0A8J2LTP6_9HEXA|nr:unnamed protein product [Allacma fusca]
MLGLGSFGNSNVLDGNKLRVFVKQGDQTVSADLDPSWNLRKIKSIVAPKLDCKPAELKIIFAGKELKDEMVIQNCNLGQNSCLFAVRVQVSSKKSTVIESIEEDEDVEGSSKEVFGDPAEDSELAEVPVVGTQGSHYFVYCNSCESFQEGKLRVRCDKCLSGAFCVLRDPESWDDVTNPKQVPGSCENSDCVGSYAQFYFKCAGHITTGEDDTAPPLALIKRNPDSVPCLACGDSKDPVLIFECASQHVTCIDCFSQYVLVKLNERQFSQDPEIGYTLGCPALCKKSLIKDCHHFKLVGKYQYDRFQRFATEEYVLKNGGVLCPQPDCGMGILLVDVGCNKIACLHGCGYVFCRLCLEGWHVGDCRQESSSSQQQPGASSSHTYSITADRAAQAQYDDSRRAVRLTTKPCPSCRVPTERAAGCYHMTCTKCQFDWCWICQVKWNRECQGNHWFG